jgi:DNA-binding MarR family transcriptional regulator
MLTVVSMETILISMETNAANTRSVPQLESHLGYWLRRVSNAVSGAFARALQEKETSVAEWVVVRELHERGQTAPGELADSLGLTRGAVSKIVDKLDAKGWIQTDEKEGDSRFRLLSITRAGRSSLPILAEIADKNDARYFNCLSAKEKNVLRKLLVKLADHNRIHDIPTE